MHFVWFPCEMDFSPLVAESHPRRKRLGWDSETRGEQNPYRMENHTKCISLFILFIPIIVAMQEVRGRLHITPSLEP